jgi:hypothetical protein
LFQKDRHDLAARITSAPRGREDKQKGNPPSLIGVEQFIRRKADAAEVAARQQ